MPGGGPPVLPDCGRCHAQGMGEVGEDLGTIGRKGKRMPVRLYRFLLAAKRAEGVAQIVVAASKPGAMATAWETHSTACPVSPSCALAAPSRLQIA